MCVGGDESSRMTVKVRFRFFYETSHLTVPLQAHVQQRHRELKRRGWPAVADKRAQVMRAALLRQMR